MKSRKLLRWAPLPGPRLRGSTARAHRLRSLARAALKGLHVIAGALLLMVGAQPVHAIVGGMSAPSDLGSHVVMIVSTRGASCSGTALARDLVLTAAHCVQPASDYAVAMVQDGKASLIPVARIEVHPHFQDDQIETRRPTPDLALIRLSAPLPPTVQPARLSTSGLPAKGTPFLVAGFGMVAENAERSAGTLRAVRLISVGTTGGIMARLVPMEGRAGACTGDSGGPAFMQDGTLAGVVSWVTGAGGARGCGGVTGMTVAGLFSDWIQGAARTLGRPLDP